MKQNKLLFNRKNKGVVKKRLGNIYTIKNKNSKVEKFAYFFKTINF